jgi:hypothetical protein
MLIMGMTTPVSEILMVMIGSVAKGRGQGALRQKKALARTNID